MYTDEAVFNKNVKATKAFSKVRENIEYRDCLAEVSPVNLIAAISEENGLEAIVTTAEFVNAEIWVTILQQIILHGKRFILFGDNVSWHTARVSLREYAKYNTFFLRNVPYTPELNPVEDYFNILKLKYKSLWLKSVVTNTKPDVEDLARTAAYSVDPKTIQ